jgi:hypothetical protein
MSEMYITEYSRVADSRGGYVAQAGHNNGSNINQKINFTATHGASASFADNTKLIRVVCDSAAYLAIGVSPVSVTATGIPVQANAVEYFGVVPGQKISAVE